MVSSVGVRADALRKAKIIGLGWTEGMHYVERSRGKKRWFYNLGQFWRMCPRSGCQDQ